MSIVSAQISLKSEPSRIKNKSSSWTKMLLRFQLFMAAYRPFSKLIFCLIYSLDSVGVGNYEQHNKAAMWD